MSLGFAALAAALEALSPERPYGISKAPVMPVWVPDDLAIPCPSEVRSPGLREQSLHGDNAFR